MHEDLDAILTIQEERRVSTNLTLTHNRILYVIDDTPEHRRLRGHRVTVHEQADGTVTIRHAGRVLPHRAHAKDTARITPGAVVEHKRLAATLQWITERQRARDLGALHTAHGNDNGSHSARGTGISHTSVNVLWNASIRLA